MRPLATSWRPAWRTAEANGAAHRVSHTNTAAETARLDGGGPVFDVLFAEHRGEPGCVGAQGTQFAVVKVGQLEGLQRAAFVFLQDQQVQDTNQVTGDEIVEDGAISP